jgi:hypothetical protein
MLLDAMITGTTGDLNGIEFVSRDVEQLTKKDAESDSWIGCAMKRRDGRRSRSRSSGAADDGVIRLKLSTGKTYLSAKQTAPIESGALGSAVASGEIASPRSAGSLLHSEKPDPYAAAICIRIRPDCRVMIWKRRLPPVYGAKAQWTLDASGCREVVVERYFFFFLAVFFAFFAFFAFLAM